MLARADQRCLRLVSTLQCPFLEVWVLLKVIALHKITLVACRASCAAQTASSSWLPKTELLMLPEIVQNNDVELSVLNKTQH